MTRRFCDLCGEEIQPAKLLFGISIRILEGALTDDGPGELEACPRCVDRVHAAFAQIKADADVRH